MDAAMSSCSSDVFMVAFYSSEVCNEYNTTVMYLGMLFAMLFTGSSHGCFWFVPLYS